MLTLAIVIYNCLNFDPLRVCYRVLSFFQIQLNTPKNNRIKKKKFAVNYLILCGFFPLTKTVEFRITNVYVSSIKMLINTRLHCPSLQTKIWSRCIAMWSKRTFALFLHSWADIVISMCLYIAESDKLYNAAQHFVRVFLLRGTLILSLKNKVWQQLLWMNARL